MRRVIIWILRQMRFLPDEIYLRLLFYLRMGYMPDLNNPKTFNEKLQWLKLHDRKPIYTTMVDKYEVKKYVASMIGEEHIIPTYAVYDSVDEIDFDFLPNQFVLKCTHDSGGISICNDKDTFDKGTALRNLKKSLSRNYYWSNREWPYKNVKPRIIAEKYMTDDGIGLKDYKFYCINGKPFCLLLASGRQNSVGDMCFDYYDMDFNHLHLENHWHPNSAETQRKPHNFELMKSFASKLSDGIPQVRVDFYEANNIVLFGEMTFYPMGGFVKIHPSSFDLEWGNQIKLP